jgi:polyisoprenoid-binding protein YceI
MSTTTTQPTQAGITIPAGTWIVDPIHSSIGFEVKHFGISTFRGRFTGYEGGIETGDGSLERVKGTVQVESVDVKDPQLAGHLQQEDFFDAANTPEITYSSTGVRQLDGERFELTGDLTIRGVTRPVILEVTVDGAGRDPLGNERISLVGNGEIDRTEFGLSYNDTMDNGVLLVGEKVRLVLSVEAAKEA